MDLQDSHTDTYAEREAKRRAREEKAKNHRISMAAMSGYTSHETGVWGTLHPAHRSGSLLVGRNPDTGKSYFESSTTSTNATFHAQRVSKTSDHNIASFCIAACITIAGGYFALNAIAELPKSHKKQSTYTVDFEENEYNMFPYICSASQRTRLLTKPKARSFVNVFIPKNRKVGISRDNTPSNTAGTYSKIIVKTEPSFFQYALSIQPELKTGYIDTNLLNSCVQIDDYSNDTSYEENERKNIPKGSRSRRKTTTEAPPAPTPSHQEPSTPLTSTFTHYVATKSSDLSVRSEPNTSSRIIATLEKGTCVRAFEGSLKESWVQVLLPDKSQLGYSSATFLKPIPSNYRCPS